MKKRYFHLFNSILAIFILLSCGGKEEMGFRIEFGNGSQVGEEDIIFYDSSTCVFFLKDTLQFTYATGDPPVISYAGFTIKADDETVYEGIVYPEFVCAIAPSTFYIGSMNYPDFKGIILPVRYLDWYAEEDLRNDPRVIRKLERADLLVSGLECELQGLFLSETNDSIIHFQFSLRNRDDINYYIPDPGKMGDDRFLYFTGGLYLEDAETEEYYFQDYADLTDTWNRIGLDDMSVLKADSTVNYTVQVRFVQSIPGGSYRCRLHFENLSRYYAIDLPLDQQDGRIWIGVTSTERSWTISE